MKNTILKFTAVAVAAALTLTACSSNTQSQNTAVGAGTGAVAGGLLGTIATGAGRGWVIAAGAVAGALLGGWAGHSMDSSDASNVNTTMDNNSIEQPSSWTNDKTGVWYKIVPTSGTVSYQGHTDCRHYKAYGKHHGKKIKSHGIACRNANGMWEQVK